MCAVDHLGLGQDPVPGYLERDELMDAVLHMFPAVQRTDFDTSMEHGYVASVVKHMCQRISVTGS
eukprot:4206775-Amphidinium_carterae.1